MKLTARAAAAALIATTLPALGSVPAHASSDDVVRRGDCTGSTDWKMKAKPDDGRIEVESEIDSNHDGQVWKWVLRHDGRVAARGSATTKGPSGSFEVTRRTKDHSGADAFRVRAVNQKSGEVCVGRVRI